MPARGQSCRRIARRRLKGLTARLTARVCGLGLLVAAMIAPLAPAQAAIHFVGAATSGSCSPNTVTNPSFTYTATAGNTLVLFGSWGTDTDDRSATWISDSAGNTWASGDYSASGKVQSLAVATATNVKGGSLTITFNFKTSESFVCWTVMEYSGAATANVVNAHNIAA